MTHINIARLSNDDLIVEAKKAAADERQATVRLVALLAEVEARELHLAQGCSSLFAYCTNVLHLSEHSAYHRIEAARATRKFPVILDRLADGALTLTAVGLLRKHLTAENHLSLLDAVRHQGKRVVLRIVAGLAPRRDVAPIIRRLPTVMPLRVAAPVQALSLAVLPAPLSERRQASAQPFALESAPVDTPDDSSPSSDRYLLRLTIGGETHAKLQRARDLLRHTLPSGDPAAIVDRALTVLVEQLERTKIAATSRSRPRSSRATRPRCQSSGSRRVPAAVRRRVWARDGGRCTFAGAEGRCAETGCLEFHHIEPYARGGRTDDSNLTLRCRAHNAYEGRMEFGERRLEPKTARPG
jgi:5-methylcytosine-specific restriction endonuclease McrA